MCHGENMLQSKKCTKLWTYSHEKTTFKTWALIDFMKNPQFMVGLGVFLKFFQLWCFKCCFFHGNGYTISCIFYFVAYFHHDTKSESSCTKSRTGNEIGQKFNFLWFFHKCLTFRKSGKKFQAFWSTEVWSIYGSKMSTWTLNTLYVIHTGADLLPDTDFNLPLYLKSEICLMINFNL